VLFVEKSRHIMASVGVTSMPAAHITENINHFVRSVIAMAKDKPGIFGKIYISATMTPAVCVRVG